MFGWRWMGLHHHVGFFGGLFGAVLHWLAAFVFVYVMARILDALAPTFAGERNRENAMKLVTYAMTPAWLAGVFALIPGLGFLRFLAVLYAIYVFWLGLPILMKSPSERLGPYALAAVLCGIVLSAVIRAILGPMV